MVVVCCKRIQKMNVGGGEYGDISVVCQEGWGRVGLEVIHKQ